MSLFSRGAAAVPATLRHWVPKCSNEMERRVRLDFEVPLNDEIIADLPEALQKLAIAIGKLDDGLTEGTFSTEFQQALDIFGLPDDPEPAFSLPNVQLINMQIFRVLPKDGPSDLFLAFSTTVRAENEFGDELVAWGLRNLHGTVFLRAYEVQGRLALEEAEVTAA